jgi:competence protein ComEC
VIGIITGGKMRRPLVIISIACVTGIIIGVYLKNSISFIFAVNLMLTLIFIINKIVRFIKIKNIYENIILISLITLIVAEMNTVLYVNKYENINDNLNERTISAEAIVCGDIKETEYSYTVNAKITKINNNKNNNNVNNYKEYNNSKNYNDDKKYNNIKIVLIVKKNKKDNASNSKLMKKLEFGTKIKLAGEYSAPEGQRNFKGYSYKEYLMTKEIYGTVKIENSNDVETIKKNQSNFFEKMINKVSNLLKRKVEILLPENSASLLKGILLGDCTDISSDVKENFKECNLSHMLAVSGAHLSYLIIGINIILSKKIFGKRASKIITIFGIIIFMNITNMSPSIERAGISSIICIIASLIHRKPDAINAVAIAMLCTVIKNPLSILNVGMQLSYAGTLSLLMFVNGREENNYRETIENSEKGKNIKKYLVESIKVTLCANILIMPLTIYKFNTISLNFILANLVAGPLLGLSLILGLIMLVTSFVSLNIAKLFSFILNIILIILIKSTKLISQIPYSNITVITPHLISIVIIYTIIFLGYYIAKSPELRKKLKTKNKLIIKTITIVLSIAIISVATLRLLEEKKLKLYFVDVGQGDCTYLKTPSGKNILIDGGGNRDKEKYDVGKKVLLPYLLDRRVKKLDYIIVSHFDADHAQGLEAVIQNIKVKNIIVCKQASDSALYQEIMKLCKKKKVNIITVKRGQNIKIDKYVHFEILHPGDIMLDDGKGGLNANAIVAKMYCTIKNKTTTIMFTGDIEEKAEEELVKIYGDKLKADILKVAHHGSKTSSIAEFLKCVSPKIALIGVGKDNTFGHPNSGVLSRLEDINAKIYRTDKLGEITVTISKNKTSIKTMIKDK